MRRSIFLPAALVLTLAACGDDAGKAVVTATTTTAAETTTTSIDPVAYRLALATIFAGEWTGEWANETFGSAGAMTVLVAVDRETPGVTLTIDLDGPVLGAGDPAGFEVVIDLSGAAPYTASTSLLGRVTVGVEATGAFILEAPDVPAEDIVSLRVTGIATSAGIALEYFVGLGDGGEAQGTVDLERPTQ